MSRSVDRMTGVLPAQTIRQLSILNPCIERTSFGGVTGGISPAGYDLRLADTITLTSGSCVLVDAIERFVMPNDIMGVLYTKSTWARLHIRVANTVIEPGWHGVLRLEISMHGDAVPRTIEQGTGIAQVVFYRLEEPTEMPYTGKYQNQGPGKNAVFEG